MKKTRISACALVALLAAGCGSLTVGIAVASLGIAGAGLATYCATGGQGCSPGLIAYATLITTEATKDVAILESGASTEAQIAQIVANLNTDLRNGQALSGLTPQVQIEVSAIVAAINTLLPLAEAMTPGATVPAIIHEHDAIGTVRLPKRTRADRDAIARMRVKIGSAVHAN